jgi:hypothetical protein
MDNLLLAIKAAGASACSGNVGLSAVRMKTVFLPRLSRHGHSCGGRTHESFKRYRKLSRLMQAESAKKTAVKLMVDFPGYLF